MNKNILLLIPLTAIVLSGCASRKEIDDKLAKGCEAGAKYVMDLTDNDMEIVKVLSTTGAKDSSDKSKRKITIRTLASLGGYAEEERDYHCTFSETYNFGFMGHAAEIATVEVDEEVYGRVDGNLKKLSLTQFQTMVGKIQRAMN